MMNCALPKCRAAWFLTHWAPSPQDHDALGLEQAAAHGLGVDACAKGLARLDGAYEGGGIGVADGPTLWVETRLGKHASELGFAGLCAAVFLFAFAPGDFMGNHGHAGAVEFDVEGLDGLERFGGRGLDPSQGESLAGLPAFHFGAGPLCHSLGLLARETYAGQLLHVPSHFPKRLLGPQASDLALDAGRMGRVFDAQFLVTRIAGLAATRTGVPTAVEDQPSQQGLDVLGTHARATHRLPARALKRPMASPLAHIA